MKYLTIYIIETIPLLSQGKVPDKKYQTSSFALNKCPRMRWTLCCSEEMKRRKIRFLTTRNFRHPGTLFKIYCFSSTRTGLFLLQFHNMERKSSVMLFLSLCLSLWLLSPLSSLQPGLSQSTEPSLVWQPAEVAVPRWEPARPGPVDIRLEDSPR